MTIRLVKKVQQESELPAVEAAKPDSCAKTIQTWVDEFKQSKRTSPSPVRLLRFGAPQIRPAGDCAAANHAGELDRLKKAS